MKLLDLYCKAGGASAGYAAAGFQVVGVDIEPQPHYPFEFIQASALDVLQDRKFVESFDAIHASPPCKVHTSLKAFSSKHHLDLVPETRELLKSYSAPWVMENVPGAPLIDPLILCGSMFDLGVRRHRLFETSFPTAQPPCRHAEQNASSPGYPVKNYHSGKPVIHMSPVIGVYGRGQGLGPGEVELWRKAMGTPWMTKDEMAQAIPPAYAQHMGNLLAVEILGLPRLA